jgi:16S rRNA (cytosine1407-C5)-methyltransferase
MNNQDATRLPEEFVERLHRIMSAEQYENVLKSFGAVPVTSFRVNTLLSEIEHVLASLREEGIDPQPAGWYDEAFWVPQNRRDDLLTSSAAESRHIYIQNLSSMLPPLVLAPEPGERVLDLTAAPGSKTLQLASLMNGEGELAAVEIVRGRFFKMKALLDEYGASSVRTFLQNGERVWRYRPEYFDRVMLDAPCSTEGRFKTSDPETYAYWSPRKTKEMARKQRRLLFSAVHALQPGGVLVYSTCTFAPEENEAMIDWALTKFGDALEIDDIHIDIPRAAPALSEWNGSRFAAGLSRAVRILPDEHFEGFFVCRLRKTESTLRGPNAPR